MKKRIPIVLLALLLLLTACAAPKTSNVEGSLEELLKKVYDGVDLEKPDLQNTVITDENMEYYFGTKDIEYTEGLASEPLINAIPHSVCLIRLKNADDAEDVKARIKANADPNKWICVGVEDKDFIVDSIGDLVILIMAEDAEKYDESFLALNK